MDFDSPYRVGFLLIDGFALMSYASAVEPLRAANLLAGRLLYDVRNMPVAAASASTSGGARIPANAQIGERADFDLFLVVAGGNPLAFDDSRVFQWLRHLDRRGVLLGGVSGGSAILARAGLMAGRRMTIHWEHAAALAETDPTLLLTRGLYVMDRDRLTCAGGTAPLDMMHALIAEHHGLRFAHRVSDWFLHTEIRPAGGPQRSGRAALFGTTNRAVVDAIEIMENHIADPLDLEQLAGQSNLGPRQLNRLFQRELGRGTMGFYRDLRLETARNLLSQSTLNITEIALATGFSGSAHFSQAFRARYGETPSSLRGKHLEGATTA